MNNELPYNDKYFHDFYKLATNNETQFVLAIIIAPYIDTALLKLNKC